MQTEDFYARLPVLEDFAEVSHAEHYAALPDDWHVAVSDVEGSTIAVRQGRYKEVNLLGASSIISVLNAVKPAEIPFIFGGDGASLCVPAILVEKARAALAATQAMARREFNLRLRAGIVPVAAIRAAGHHVKVARIRTSANYIQAAFTGGGIQFAERLIKDLDKGKAHRIESESQPQAAGDFSGLECRWDNIPSPHGEIVTLLVQAAGADDDRDALTYRDVLDQIGAIYGIGQAANPIVEQNMRLSLDGRKIGVEARIRSRSWLRSMYRLWMRIQSVIGQFVMDRGIRFAGVDWGAYRADVIANSDFRKFDDLLRHVLSGDTGQRDRLTAFLEARHVRGELAYGMHWSPTALMTCLIFRRQGGHIHFVDGANGGYALASEDLKKRLAALADRGGNSAGRNTMKTA